MDDEALEAAIAAGLEHWDLMRECVRAEAIKNARELVERKLGALERADFEQLFAYFHTDWSDGKTTLTRFATAFTGALANSMLDELDALNMWTKALWQAEGDEAVVAMLDGFWATPVRGAGQSYPTMLLHVREPERYWIITSKGPGAGYRRLSGRATGRSGARYLEYVRWIRALRERFEISTHAIDLVLSSKIEKAEAKPHAPAIRTSLLTDVELAGAIQAIDWAPGEALLAIGTKEGGLSFWHADSGKVSAIQTSGPEIAGLWWLASGERLVGTGPQALLMTWDSVSPGQAQVIAGAGLAIAGSPDGTRAAVITKHGYLDILDVQAAQPESLERTAVRGTNLVAWSKRGDLALADEDMVELRSFGAGPLPLQFHTSYESPENPTTSLAWSADGSILAIARKDGSITLAIPDVSTLVLDRKGKTATSIAWHPMGTCVATSHVDGHVRIWDAREGSLLTALSHAKTRSIAWSKDGRLLASGSREGKVRVWQVKLADDPVDVRDAAPTRPASPTAAPQLTAAARELVLELRLARPRICEIRRAAAPAWHESPTLLPDLRELECLLSDGTPREIELLGRQLFATIVCGEIADAYRGMRSNEGPPLRVLLRMHEDADAPGRCSIAEYPWETLLDPEQGPLAIDQGIRLVRSRAAHEALAPPQPSAKLRTLVGFADPDDLPQLDLYREFAGFERLQRATAASEILELRYEAGLGLATVQACLHAIDVFHFAGHGERGGLVFEGPGRRAEVLDSHALRALLVPPLPRVVVLNACEGSLASAAALSVAEAFASRGVPIVIAMSGTVDDGSALTFGRELHERLAAGIDIEQAVQQARWRVYAERGSSWFMPVVWTRVEQSFALVDPSHAHADAVTRAELERLDGEAARLRPRVVVQQRLLARELDDVQRAELTEALLEQTEHAPAGEREALLERLLASEAEITRQLVRIEQRHRDPSKALHGLANTLQRELGALPSLLASLRQATAPTLPSPRVGLAASNDDAFALPFAASSPLAAPDDVARLVRRAKGKLQLDDELVRRCIIHLLAGRHVVLAGPPGTGKSTLAKGLARAFGYAFEMVTANPEWTTYDTIGGLAPKSLRDDEGRSHLGYPFEPGCVLRAVEANWTAHEAAWVRRPAAVSPAGEHLHGTWLVIDEMNRAPLDQAFGELFTALVDGELRDPRRAFKLPIPRDFRLICTANTADRRLLFEFSEALKRRFAFVEVPAFTPPDRSIGDHRNLLEQLGERDGVAPTVREGLEPYVIALDEIVQRVRLVHPLGLAQVLDMLTFVAVGLGLDAEDGDALVSVALVDNLVPALETLPAVALDALAALLDGSVASWIARMTREVREGYRSDPAAKRVALALLHDLDPTLVAHDWLEALEQHAAALAERAPALPSATTLVRVLRRLALERDA